MAIVSQRKRIPVPARIGMREACPWLYGAALPLAPLSLPMPPLAINRHMTPTEWGLLIFLGLLWGGSYFYNAIALELLPPMAVVAFRVSVGGFLLYLVVRASGQRMPRDRLSWQR